MSIIRAVVRNGRLEPTEPITLPEGTEVHISLADSSEDADGWNNSKEGITAWLNWYETLEPLIFTEAEHKAWEAARQERKDWEKAHFNEYTEKLQQIWK